MIDLGGGDTAGPFLIAEPSKTRSHLCLEMRVRMCYGFSMGFSKSHKQARARVSLSSPGMNERRAGGGTRPRIREKKKTVKGQISQELVRCSVCCGGGRCQSCLTSPKGAAGRWDPHVLLEVRRRGKRRFPCSCMRDPPSITSLLPPPLRQARHGGQVEASVARRELKREVSSD